MGTVLDRIRHYISASFPFPAFRSFASTAKPVGTAQLLVRLYYGLLLFVAVVSISGWATAPPRALDPLWPIFWTVWVDVSLAAHGIGLFFVFAAALAAYQPERRWVRTLAFMGVLESAALQQSVGEVGLGMHTWVLTAFLLLFLPDRWNEAIAASPRARERFLLIFWGCQAVILFTYAVAGLGKLYGIFLQAASGELASVFPSALSNHIAHRIFMLNERTPLGVWLIDRPWIGLLLFLAAMYLQFFSWWAAFRPRLYRLWGLGLVLFHAGNYLITNIRFSHQILLLLLFFTHHPFSGLRIGWADVLRDLPLGGKSLFRLGSMAVSAPKQILLPAFLLVGVAALAFSSLPRSSPTAPAGQERCSNLKEENQQYACWADYLEIVSRNQGVPDAFRLMATLYVNEPGARKSCHALTHRIGGAAYRKFATSGDITVTPETAFCNFGFYHGFMEALAADGQDIARARAFCARVDTEPRGTPDAGPQCFHGIGHGMVNGHEPKLWGNDAAMVNRALHLCEAVADTADRRYRCATGVFNGLAIFYVRGEYGLSMADIHSDDPLRICREQAPAYRQACYGNMKIVFSRLTGRDFPKMLTIAERIPDEQDAAATVWYLAGFNIERKLDRTDYGDDIRACRSLREPLRLPCIQGLATGFLWYGFPGHEYEGALHFCGAERLSHDERQACFDKISSLLPIFYPRPRVTEICKTIPAPYRAQCGTPK